MKSIDLCQREVVTVPISATLTEVSRLMRERHVGSVVVTRAEGARQPAGIITDRDIVVELVSEGLDPAGVTAGEVMSEPLAVARDDDDALWALKIMRDRGVRRLPVVDANGDLAGILAFDDVLEHVGGTLGDIAQVIGTERRAEAARRD